MYTTLTKFACHRIIVYQWLILAERPKEVRTSVSKSQITLIGCVSTTGHAIAPFVIYDSKSFYMKWRKGEVLGTSCGFGNKGWVNAELLEAGLLTISLRMQLVVNHY